MYSLDINFLNDRPEFAPEVTTAAAPAVAAAPTVNPLPAIVGLLLMVSLPGGMFGFKLYSEKLGVDLTNEKNSKTDQLNQLSAQAGQIKTLQDEEAKVNTEIQSLVDVFGKVQPMSALLQEVSNHIPGSLRLSTLTISGTTMTLSGTASSYADLTDFLLMLKKSIFIKPEDIKLGSSSLGTSPLQVQIQYLQDIIAAQNAAKNGGAPVVPSPQAVEGDRPKVKYKLPEVVNYTITTQLISPDALKSLDQLRTLGAEGLVERVELLKQRGIL
jgi:type IV pilus assembly protein PilN